MIFVMSTLVIDVDLRRIGRLLHGGLELVEQLLDVLVLHRLDVERSRLEVGRNERQAKRQAHDR